MGTPLRVFNDGARGILHIEWPDAQTQDLSHRFLREQCHCAFCRARQLKGEAVSAAADLRITALHAQGYGLQIIFSDGHDRGIYPWAYLQGLAAATQ